MLGLAIFSVLLAYISWKYIEKPFRNAALFTKQKVFYFSLCGVVLFITLGITGHLFNGKITRLPMPSDEYNYYDYKEEGASCFRRKSEFCGLKSDTPKIFVIGDSTVHPIATALHFKLPEYSIVPITAPGCVLIVSSVFLDGKEKIIPENCNAQKFVNTLKLIKSEKPPVIIFGGRLSAIISGTRISDDGSQRIVDWGSEYFIEKGTLEENLEETIQIFGNLTRKLFVVELPEFGFNPLELSIKAKIYGMSKEKYQLNKSILMKRHFVLNQVLTSNPELNFHPVTGLSHLCDKNEICSAFNDEFSFYSDAVHISSRYADMIANEIIDTLSEQYEQ